MTVYQWQLYLFKGLIYGSFYKHLESTGKNILHVYIDGLVQDCSIPSALAMEIPQSCTKSLIWNAHPCLLG